MTNPNFEELPEGSADTFQAFTQQASAAFFQMMQERHVMGEAKYGPVKFMNVNTLEEAMEETVDIANYAMYTFMKLYALNEQLPGLVAESPDTLGPTAFVPTKPE